MKRFAIFAVAFALAAGTLLAAPPSNSVPLPVTGTFIDSLGGTGSFEGTFHLTKFAATDAGLVAKGLLTGTLTDSAGTSLGSLMKSVTIPVTNIEGAGISAMAVRATATCDILHLELGPLDLDLLGLVVHLDKIVLDIDAESGSGNLLGNLLCALTGLLDGAGALAEIVNLLNRILDVISGLLG